MRGLAVLVLGVGLVVFMALGQASAGSGLRAREPSWARVAPEQIAEAKKHGVPVAFENALGMRFVLIPAGTFRMGCSPDDEASGCREMEREVLLTRPFYVQTTEVTSGQYRRLHADHRSGSHDGYDLDADDQPVVRVSWVDADAFAAELSAYDESRDYALPTEAQWERACRAGTTTRFWFGDRVDPGALTANGLDLEAYGVLEDTADDVWPQADGCVVSAPVASFPANGWALHDMTGNVWEWCHDYFETFSSDPVVDPRGPAEGLGDMHIMRGGSYMDAADDFRSGVRRWMYDFVKQPHIGFRLVSPVPESME